MPQSAAEASPGPFTTQPITATVMGFSTPFNRSSTWFASPIRSIFVRPQVGQDTSSGPTCGRTKIDLISLANQVEERLKTVDKPITVAVMGCAVNGPGEARSADCGIAGGIGEGLLFQRGEIVKKVPQDRLVDELFALIERL